MEEIQLDSQIEAILFWKGEPQSIKKLAASLGKKEEEIRAGLEVLKEKIKDRGVELVFKDDEVMLGTSSRLAQIIERLTKEELVRDLGKAGLETISIIAYKGPISRAEIDYIRGVQSNFILRNLQIRGLVEKVTDEKDQRRFLYRPTFDLLSFLGVSKIEDLPEYEKVKAEFEQATAEKTDPALPEIDPNEPSPVETLEDNHN
jgi:segregation and condensation protein B